MNSTKTPASNASGPWWRELNGYHWFVFFLAAFGWMFDCFDQQIFTNSRSITMQELVPDAHAVEGSMFVKICAQFAFLRALIPHTTGEAQLTFGTLATSIFIIGWATGGLIFGTIGDKWGRAKPMAVTIFVYALCTGLSGFAHSWSMFALFRFL